MKRRGIPAESQVALPVIYRGLFLESGYRLDLLVANSVIVEVKALEGLKAIHKAQLLTYLRLSGHRLGLLINFQERALVHGVRRIVNHFPKAA